MAYRCLLQLESRLQKNSDLYDQYRAFIQEFLDLGHAHYIDKFSPADQDAYYMPHFAVLRPDSVTTKLRTVFNASAKTSSGLSLNDVLFEGPNIYNDIFDIILRFRLYKYAFSCDIVKMFRGIFINPQQTSLQRILWRNSNSEPLRCIELDTVAYGTKCAPFLACRVMLDLAEKYKDTHKSAASCLNHNSYMDDYLCGEQTEEKCLQLSSELIDLLSKAGFKLHKWSSNLPNLSEHVSNSKNNCFITSASPNDSQPEDNSYNFSPPTSVKTLGLQWLPTADTLQVSIPSPTNVSCTKRNILSQIAQIFDPIGLLAPFTILPKLLMQDIWKQNTDWDSLVSDEIQRTWLNYATELRSYRALSSYQKATINSSIRIEWFSHIS
ncbi:hypothetical protein ABMA28_013810 [Loxostege sticticalis]|uniref:Reverse transcriptase domain-containing protein n=1 Tax=Loxostege sticticalis TaxID=481309 RepID=A0ABD0TJR8_LOXSC